MVKSFKKASRVKQSEIHSASLEAMSSREFIVKLQEQILLLKRKLQSQENETATRNSSTLSELLTTRKRLNQCKDELQTLKDALKLKRSDVKSDLDMAVEVTESNQLRELNFQLKITQEQLEKHISSALVRSDRILSIRSCLFCVYFCHFV